MDTPIISPWILYFINICGTIRWLFGLFLPMTLMAFVVSYIGYIVTTGDCYEEEHSIALKSIKISCLSLLIAIMTCVVVPSQQTCYQMLAASYVTPANINKAGETADVLLDKLCDKIVNMSDKMDRKKK